MQAHHRATQTSRQRSRAGYRAGMAEQGTYVVRYPGALAARDRAALDRAGFEVYENGYGVSAAHLVGEPRAR